MSQSIPAGTALSLGWHYVTYTVNFYWHGSPNGSDSMSDWVYVRDAAIPVISQCPAPATAGEYGTATLPDMRGGLVAQDCSGISSIVQTPPPGSILPAGIHSVNFVVSDLYGQQSSCATTFTVYSFPAPALLEPISEQIREVNSPIVLTIPPGTFSGPASGQLYNYSATGLPAWLSFDAATRTFSGTPTAPSQFTLTVRVTDNGVLPRFAEVSFSVAVLGTAVPPPGLVAWWRGFGNADDVFGRADGTFHNGMTAAGGIFTLDGSDDTMVIGQPPILDQPNGTWSAWIRPTAAPTGRYAVVLSRWENAPGGNSVSLFIHQPGPPGSAWLFQGDIAHGPQLADSQYALSPTIIQPDTWTHVALTFDDATDSLKIYLNGELQGTATQAGSLFHGNGQWRLGFNPGSVANAFPGQMSDPMIFNRALSAAELQGMVTAGIGGFALNSPPTVVAAIADQVAHPGRPFTFTVPANTFADADAGQTLTYSATGLPAWLSFNPATRTFSGTPPALGASTVTVTATDSGALAMSTPFTLTVRFSPDALVARYNFVANGWAEPGVPGEVRGSFTATFEPITDNGFNVAQLDAVVFQVNGVTYTPQNTGVVVQNGRRTGAGGANHEGRFELGGLASGGISSVGGNNHDFRLAFTDFSGVIDPPSFMFSKAGGGLFVATAVTVTRAAAAPVFTAKYAFSATGFAPAGPDATVAGSFTATFKHTGLTGGAGWVPSILEMLDLTINGVAQDPATVDLNVRNVSIWPQGFNARFELGGRLSAYSSGMNTDDFQLQFTDFGGFGDGIAASQFVYTTTQALGFHTASTVTVTRVAADPLPGGDIAVEQPAGSPVWSGLTTADFGTVTAGTPVGRTFRVRNLGAGPLGGLAVTVHGAAATDYSVSGIAGGPLAPGGDTTFTVTCNPTAGGARTATLRLRSSDPRENPFDVPLTATGLLPEITVEQPAGTVLADGVGTVSFGASAVGGAPLSRSFTVRNTGTGQLSLAGVSVTGGQAGEFTVSAGSLPLALGPGGQASFSVAFIPAAIGPRGTTLVITSNDADASSFEIALLGIGTINLPPNGTPDTIQRLSSSEIAKVPVAGLLGNDSDPDSDPLSLVSVGNAQPAGASISLAGGWVTYRAPAPGPGAGSFTYTLGDGQGHTVVVSVTVNDYSGPTSAGLANAQRITPAGDDITMTFIGVPGRSYRVQFTTGGAPPYAWADFSPPADYVAPANGVFIHTDPQPTGPVRLYRAVAR